MPAVIQLPIGAEGHFKGVIDLVTMKALVWDETHGARASATTSSTSPPSSRPRPRSGGPSCSTSWPAEDDDPHGEVPRRRGARPRTTSSAAIRKGTLAFSFVPVLCGSAFKNKGVQPMLDAVVDYLPRPLDIPPAEGTDLKGIEIARAHRPTRTRRSRRWPSRSWPTRSASSPTSGSTRARVDKGDEVYNSTKDRKERLGRILLMHANQREDLDVAMAGDIVAGLGFKNTTTGDTLCDRANPIVLERMEFPEPVIHVAIEPKTKADQDKLGKALYSLSEEDPTFRVRTDEETGQTVISGMGELHLEVLVDRMLREFNVDATVGKPQVAYRETITKPVEHRRVPPHEADRWLRPVRRRQDQPRADRPRRRLRVRRQDHRRPHPAEYIPAVDQGIQAALDRRRARRLPDGRRPGHARRRPVPRRRLVARWRSRSPARWRSRRRPEMAKPVLLEPIMAVEVVTPEDYMGDVIGDLSSRRGRIEGMEAAGQQPGRPGPGAAVGDVRLRYRPPFADPGPRHVHHAVPLVPAGARERSPTRSSSGSAASSQPSPSTTFLDNPRATKRQQSHEQGEV